MEENYFVMLNHPSHAPLPMMRDDEDIAWYSSIDDAENAAKMNPLGEAYGYTIYERDDGCI